MGQPTQQVPKQFQLLAGKLMVMHSVQTFLDMPEINSLWVGVSPDLNNAKEFVSSNDPRLKISPTGGDSRHETVLQTLKAMLDSGISGDDWVLVHDAARPGLPLDALARLIDACLADGVGGLLAMPAADTLKKAQPSSDQVAETLDREGLWLAQTPQMFRAGLLLEALTRAVSASEPPTDEAQAMEALGYAPILVRGSGKNTKITWPEDFQWVESWL